MYGNTSVVYIDTLQISRFKHYVCSHRHIFIHTRICICLYMQTETEEIYTSRHPTHVRTLIDSHILIHKSYLFTLYWKMKNTHTHTHTHIYIYVCVFVHRSTLKHTHVCTYMCNEVILKHILQNFFTLRSKICWKSRERANVMHNPIYHHYFLCLCSPFLMIFNTFSFTKVY